MITRIGTIKKIEIIAVNIKGKDRFGLCFPFDNELIRITKTIPGAIWDRERKCWHVAMTQANFPRLEKIFSNVALINMDIIKSRLTPSAPNSFQVLGALSQLDQENLNKLLLYMKFRRYGHSTIRTYHQILATFFRFRDPDIEKVRLEDEIIRFTNEYILSRRLSYSYQNQFMNALRLFYRQIVPRALEIESVKRPRGEHRLPNVLSKEEVSRLIKVMKNLKHRAMLSLTYGCGLRRGELLNLKPIDLDSKRGLVMVRMGKGKKDRIVPLPKSLIELLRAYYKEDKPAVWLFEGRVKGRQYDERSIEMVIKKAIYLAGIKKPVTLHWLRHSYATHLHESGVDIHLIQLLLGHKSTKTTEIYTHVSTKSIQQIRSPFDDL